MRSNREYDYFGNVLEYEYDYFPSYSSTRTRTQKVLVLEYKYKCTITPSLVYTGQVFLFVINHLASCVDNMSKLCFILGTDIAIPCTCNFVKRYNALY